MDILGAQDSAELVRRIRGGDRAAEARFARLYCDCVFAVALARTHNRAAARELMDDVLMAVVLALLIPSVLAVLAVLVLTVIAAAVWISAIPASVTVLPPMLFVIGGVAVFFLAAAALAVRWLPSGAKALKRHGVGPGIRPRAGISRR